MWRSSRGRVLPATPNHPEHGGGGWFLLASNPCSIKGPTVEPTHERQLPSLADVYALADEVQPQLRAMVLLAAFGGLRRGELLGLTRRGVDLLHRTVTVRVQRQVTRVGAHDVGPPKTEAGRRTLVLPNAILPDLAEHLARWAGPGSDGLLFSGAHGAPLRVCVWQREWTRARRFLGLQHVRLNVFGTSRRRWRR